MIRAALIWAALAAPAVAQDGAEAAREAAAMLAEAGARLEAAQGATDRVGALTGVVRAYEAGLAALREGLRRVSAQERALTADLAAREEEIARLLGVMAGMGQTPEAGLLLHPSGALGAARAGMMLGDAAPALRTEAQTLRRDLAVLDAIRALEEEAAADLRAGLDGIQATRLALSQAIADRTGPPEARADLAALRARIDTLEEIAQSFDQLPQAQTDLDLPLGLPAPGPLLRRPGEADAAGIRRPGLILAPPPGTEVTAPAAGTVRFAGPLLDYDLVILLEPRPGLMLVFGGLSEVYVSKGQIVPGGARLGAMGGPLRDGAAGAGASRPDTLYVEVREAGRPADPSEWFAFE
ncbi:murein hydrolase activator EnvC family protein [Jannaschia seohaensis]|uniref:Septal ring factor EnvC (AmiA/AmiB activator) n=1 Tax=Jannaschia seohaensis TaxID=475081 RepID=A0A2Y9A2M0_9RHOB|nr:peptidoglycan DD-metalloendopeptidase family protein [Jannaschia seohaensis]PWJ22187.1 septal ring factor EnvC (AmiA/AmiB activator) [Jannaschia seohaensis]SSA38465.1 Septal ring factor EnvC, activator of murein hydrolases AmiA and AmiB [Jannaschia seohaensis]